MSVEGMSVKIIIVGKSWARILVPAKDLSYKISFIVHSSIHLAVELVHYVSVSCMRYKLAHAYIGKYSKNYQSN